MWHGAFCVTPGVLCRGAMPGLAVCVYIFDLTKCTVRACLLLQSVSVWARNGIGPMQFEHIIKPDEHDILHFNNIFIRGGVILMFSI